MKKLSTFLCTLALLFGVVGVANAGKLYWSPQSGFSTWNSGTNTMTWASTDDYGVHFIYTGFTGYNWSSSPQIDYSAYTKIHLNVANVTSGGKVQLKIASAGHEAKYIDLAEGPNDIIFSKYSSDIDITQINELSLFGAGVSDGSAEITNVYMQKPEDVVTCTGHGDEITSLAGITDGTRFVISDNGTKAKYFYGTGSGSGEHENKNAELASIPAGSYFYFTLQAYTGDDIENAYWIKITNADGDGYPYGSDGASNYYLNAVLGYANVVISGTKDGWGGDKKDALWYVTYDAEKGFSFQNVYRSDNSLSSWLAIGNNFADTQQYLKLYKSINFNVNAELDAEGLDFDAFGLATTDKRCLVATGGLSYDRATGVLTSDGTAGTLTLEFTNPVDLKYLNTFVVNRTEGNDGIISRLEFYDEDNTKINTWNTAKLASDGLDNNATNTFLNNKPVKKMVWVSDANDGNNGKSFTISGVTFQLKTIACLKAGETQLNTLAYKTMGGVATSPAWNMNTSTTLYYGSATGDAAVSYADVTEYKEIRIYRDENTNFRAFFINAGGTNVNTINKDHDASSWNATGKYWSIDLSKVEKYGEKVALQGIKSTAYNAYDIVRNIAVYKTPAANAPKYTLTGSGLQLAGTVAALADATATYIDATGVTGITTNSEKGRTLLTSANPNCIFLGSTGNGHLANTNNVMDGTTIANLNITDGHPFAVPAGATATAATYTRTMANKYGTICLPYAVSSNDDVKYYTIESLSGDELTLTPTATLLAGTPAIVEKVSGDAITVEGSGALAVAGEPTDDLKLIGTYEAKTILASAYAPKNIYAIAENKFWQATEDITLPAFRAYFVSTPASASLRLGFEEEGATAIEALSGEGDVVVEGIYSLDGTQIPSLQKGVNVVKFTNGEVKKVIVK